jgi:alpha-beta hydrolase superfamily lysophospholipase
MPQLVAVQSHQVSAADGTMLYVTDYLLPASQARGSVVLMHGLGEHSGRYRHVAGFFNECGLSVRCYDHRGHGRSQGKRGDVINGDPMLPSRLSCSAIAWAGCSPPASRCPTCRRCAG